MKSLVVIIVIILGMAKINCLGILECLSFTTFVQAYIYSIINPNYTDISKTDKNTTDKNTADKNTADIFTKYNCSVIIIWF